MNENYSENEQNREVHGSMQHRHNPDESPWVRYLMALLGAFLGAFLAVYFILDVSAQRFLYPSLPRFSDSRDIDEMIKEQNREMNNFVNGQHMSNPFVSPFVPEPVKVQTTKNEDNYKIVIDLKPFNGDEKDIIVKAKAHRISIEGKYGAKKDHSQKNISFSQNFSLPEAIDVKNITKEKKGNNYIITLPFEEE